MWKKEAISQEFKDATIIHLVKQKGNPQIIRQSSEHLIIASCWEEVQESYWTDWTNTLNSQGFYQKANVDSGRTEEQLIWSSAQDSF